MGGWGWGVSRKATKFDIYFSEIGICRLVFLDLSWGVPNSVRYFCHVIQTVGIRGDGKLVVVVLVGTCMDL